MNGITHLKKALVVNDYRFYRIGALLWMGLIFFLSSQSDLPLPDVVSYSDKIAHGVAFGILGILYAGSFRESLSSRNAFLKRILYVTLLVTLYGAFDEIHQSFVPGRDVSLLDLLADASGGFLFTTLFLCFKVVSPLHQNIKRS